jgi:hypothetical protein
MAAMAPAHLFGLYVIDFLTRGDSRMRRETPALIQRMRHQRRGLCRRGKRRGTRDNAQCNLQKIPPFHLIFLLSAKRVMQQEFAAGEMNTL